MDSNSAGPPLDPSERRSVSWARAGLVGLGVAFAAYCIHAVPRLTNNLVGDSEFTGWTGPFGERLLAGDTPYTDFVLPIPPGSFVVMAAVQRAAGGAALIQELWVAAVCHFAMALLGYVIARAFVPRRIAFMAAAATLATVVQLYKECVYDHTAQVVAWASLAAGAHGLVAQAGRRRRRLLVLAGGLATFTFAFKQSTGSGAVAGYCLAFAYLFAVHLSSRDRPGARARLEDLRDWAGGAALGCAAVVVVVWSVGSPIGAFVQAVFTDGPELKGGSTKLLFNLFSYLFRFEAVPASLAAIAATALVLRRALRADDGLALPDAATGDPEPRFAFPAAVVIALLAFAGATVLLSSGAQSLPPALLAWAERAKLLPTFGLMMAVVLFVATLRRLPEPGTPRARALHEHAVNAILLLTLACSLLHNLSFPGFRPFYDNNPIIAVAFALLFATLERARLPKLGLLAFAFALFVLPGQKLARALEANLPAGPGHWHGLTVNLRGAEVLKAADRVRSLTEPNQTVLVIPEDVQLARLIGRPRPPIRGAIVFVDQYPRRLLEDDLRTLERDLPKVVVTHPADPKLWRQMFALWSTDSAAQVVADRFVQQWLPQHYRLDSTFPTRFARTRSELQVWVRKN